MLQLSCWLPGLSRHSPAGVKYQQWEMITGGAGGARERARLPLCPLWFGYTHFSSAWNSINKQRLTSDLCLLHQVK